MQQSHTYRIRTIQRTDQKCKQTTSRKIQVDRDFQKRWTRTPAANSVLPQLAVTFKIEAEWSYQTFVLGDSEVLRNRQLRQHANRCRKARKKTCVEERYARHFGKMPFSPSYNSGYTPLLDFVPQKLISWEKFSFALTFSVNCRNGRVAAKRCATAGYQSFKN